MSELPDAYAWLLAEPAPPRMTAEAIKLFGTLETPGSRSNPVILDWAREIGGAEGATAYEQWVVDFYKDDGIPWCGLAAGIVAHRAGKKLPPKFLSALAWRDFGTSVDVPMLGDIMVKARDGGGHVTQYIGEDATHFHCIGGNQSDAFNIARYPKTIDWDFRRPIYINQPASVRRVILAAGGAPVGGKED
jgi:uncharacterized protein (TIGR02594 family)